MHLVAVEIVVRHLGTRALVPWLPFEGRRPQQQLERHATHPPFIYPLGVVCRSHKKLWRPVPAFVVSISDHGTFTLRNEYAER